MIRKQDNINVNSHPPLEETRCNSNFLREGIQQPRVLVASWIYQMNTERNLPESPAQRVYIVTFILNKRKITNFVGTEER